MRRISAWAFISEFQSALCATEQGTTTYFRGTVDAARECGLQLHNRWNPELNTALIPGYLQVMSWTGDRLSSGCLWTERIPLLDTWESVTSLSFLRDGAGIASCWS